MQTRTAEELKPGDRIVETMDKLDDGIMTVETLELLSTDREGDTVYLTWRCVESTGWAGCSAADAVGRTISDGPSYWDRYTVVNA